MPQRLTGIKTLTPKQMPQRLSIVLTQVKTGNKSKTVLNETCHQIHSLPSAIKFTKKQCN